jgi:hypothetical protein
MSMHRIRAVVKRHLARTGAIDWNQAIVDLRGRRGRRHSWARLMSLLWASALCATKTLRGIEELSERMGRRVSDTTLWRVLRQLPVEPLRALLAKQVRAAWRAKELTSHLPLSMVAVDGKTIWVGRYKANRYCQLQAQDDYARFHMRVLRAVWVSGPCALTVGQMPIPAQHSECSTFGAFLEQLLADYGKTDMLQVLSLDAGYVSLHNATLIDEAQRGYLMALKNPQKDLVDEARSILGRRRRPDAETPWERYRGRRIRRQLFRTTQLAGYNGWHHLRQVWRVRQETEHDGKRAVEERYFVTNLPAGTTRDDIPLKLVRAHWGIENRSNWTMDTVWGEDRRPWAGGALEAVALLRLMALNVVTRLRCRRFRSARNRSRPWRTLLAWIGDVLVQDDIARRTTTAQLPKGVAALE